MEDANYHVSSRNVRGPFVYTARQRAVITVRWKKRGGGENGAGGEIGGRKGGKKKRRRRRVERREHHLAQGFPPIQSLQVVRR